MLTTQSYLVGMLVYWSAAVLGLLLLRRLWFGEPMTRASGALLGVLAGLLLMPAFPGPEVATMAPALVVVIFNSLFGDGLEAAMMPGVMLLAGMLTGGCWAAGGLASVQRPRMSEWFVRLTSGSLPGLQIIRNERPPYEV